MEGPDEDWLDIAPLATVLPAEKYMDIGRDDNQHCMDKHSSTGSDQSQNLSWVPRRQSKEAVGRKRPERHLEDSPQAPSKRRAESSSIVMCRVCEVPCMTAFHLEQHEKGKKHRHMVASLAGKKNVRCEVCGVLLLSEVNILQHYASKKHVKRLRGEASGGAAK